MPRFRLRTVVFAAALAAPAAAQVSYYSASLDGAQEVPPNASTGRGWAVVRLTEPANTVFVFAHVEGLGSPTNAAHLHQGAVGANGGIILPLASGPATWSGTGALTAAQVNALKTGGTYVNVHTNALGGGEVRGQVLESLSTRFVSFLDGAQEVPPSPSAATGTGVLFLHRPDNRLVYTVTTPLTAALVAHLHAGPPGVAGPIVFPLDGGAGVYCGVSNKLTATEITALETGLLYLNIHTAAFPNGEIRGQVLASAGDDFGGAMDGGQEVPPNAATGTGVACIQILPNRTVRYRVEVTGLTGPPSAAHVHVGAPGVAGGIVFPLAGGPTVFSGTSPVLTATQLADCRAGNWYANVHTGAFPGGEVRGQLAALDLPTVYGGSCTGSNGKIVQIAADGAPCLGGSLRIDAHGSIPGVLALFNLGFSRDANGAIPLPVEFTTMGFAAPHCFFVAAIGATTISFTDARGCAHQTLNLPFAPFLAGTPVFAQWFVFDTAANAFGLVSSNGLSMVLQ
jgi:hypothetical protein